MKHLQQYGYIQISSHGVSMYPFIQEGDECVFIQVALSKLEEGDVVLYRASDAKLVGHRLMHVTHRGDVVSFLMKGDSNVHPDAPISSDAILGKLASIERRGRQIRVDNGVRRVWTWSILHIPLVSKACRQLLIQRHIWVHRMKRLRGLDHSSIHKESS